MKKTFKFIGLLAMAAVLFSCEKKIDPVNPTPKDDTEQGTDIAQYDPSEYLVSFGATIETPGTKATIDPGTGKVAFEENDEVLVVSGDKTATYYFNGTEFVPIQTESPIAISENGMTVYYPYSESDPEFSVSEGTVSFIMPLSVVDTEDLGMKAPMAAQIVQDGASFKAEFKNICSVLQVNVTGELEISSVKLQNAGSSRMPLGEGATFTIGWNDEAEPTMTANESAENAEISILREVTLSATPQTFYYIIPAGVAYTDVSILTQFANEASIGGVSTFTVSRGNWTADRNQIYTMSFYAGLFSGGDGTEENPYKIANSRDFKNLIKYCSEGYGYDPNQMITATTFLAAHYQQTADIDFKDAQMSPIGDSSHQFTGTYDGNGKQLKNVNINETGQFAGIFAYANENASIKNLTVSGNIKKTGATDNSCVGAIAGIVRGAATVTGCTNNATITSSATYTGGIAGRLYQSTSSTAISGCTNNGSVTSSVSYTGGIVGQQIHGGTIVECVNKGTVSGTSYVGGIVGDMGAAGAAPSAISFISFCRNDATINASANCSGGIAGRIINGSVVSSCFAKGTVSSESYDVGGIAGLVQVNNSNTNSRVCVYDCLTAMNVTTTRSGASNEARTGGAVGFVFNNQAQYIAIDNCGVIATSVTVGGGTKVGGFVGRFASSNTNKNRTRIRNCYTLVSSISSPNSLYGGFVGNAENYGELHYCYYVADDTYVNINNNTTQDNLTKKTAEEIASNATCETFNANNYVLTIGSNNYGSSLGWNIPAGCDYPVPGSLISKGEEYYK